MFGAGGADIGVHIIKDSEIYDLLKKGNEKIKGLDKKLMVTHMHPQGTKSEFSGFKGSKAVREAIEKTDEEVDLVVLDWKGLGKSEERKRVIEILDKMHVDYKKTSGIRK